MANGRLARQLGERNDCDVVLDQQQRRFYFASDRSRFDSVARCAVATLACAHRARCAPRASRRDTSRVRLTSQRIIGLGVVLVVVVVVVVVGDFAVDGVGVVAQVISDARRRLIVARRY